MARDFTSEELKQIRESSEFQEYLQKAGEDETNLALTHYLQNAKNLSYWEEKFTSDVKQHSDEMVIDLSSLDKYKEIGEVIRALRDEDFKSEINDILAKAYEFKKNGNVDKFNEVIAKLQQNASTQNLHSVQLAMDDKGYMYDYTSANKTHTEEREVPDLSALVLHMRNNSMTAEILQERLNDIRANHPDDKRAIELYETVINAYRTGKGVDKLNDLVKDENDVRIAEDMAREVEYDNAYDVPRIKKQIEVPGPDVKKEDNKTHLEEREVPDLSALVLHMRNNSMSAEILQERLNDIRANHPDDKRAIELYETVINAYRTGKGVDKLNDLVKDENDVRIAEDMAREVEYDNAYDVPRIKKQIEVSEPDVKKEVKDRDEPKKENKADKEDKADKEQNPENKDKGPSLYTRMMEGIRRIYTAGKNRLVALFSRKKNKSDDSQSKEKSVDEIIDDWYRSANQDNMPTKVQELATIAKQKGLTAEQYGEAISRLPQEFQASAKEIVGHTVRSDEPLPNRLITDLTNANEAYRKRKEDERTGKRYNRPKRDLTYVQRHNRSYRNKSII